MARRSHSRQPRPRETLGEPPPPKRLPGHWAPVPAAFGLGLLLPLLGAGLPLDDIPTPGVVAGQLVLALLALTVCLTARQAPARRDLATFGLGALVAIGLVGLLIPRGGPWVDPGGLPGAGEAFRLRLPADVENGRRELLRLGLLALLAVAGRRAPVGAVLAGLAAGGCCVGLRGLQEYLLQLRAGDASWRVFAGFTNPNLLASYLLVALGVAVAVALLADDESPPGRWLAAQAVARPGLKLRLLASGLAVGLVLILGLTGSRGGLIGLLLGITATVLALARSGSGAVARRLGLVLPAAAGLALLGPLRNRAAELLTSNHSILFRLLTWRGTLTLCASVWALGVGLGGWPLSYPVVAVASYTHHAHSGYLQVAAETGLPGLVAYLTIWLAWLLLGWQAVTSGDRRRRAVGLGLLAAVAGFGFHNGFDSGWYITATAGSMVLLAGAASRLGAPLAGLPPLRRQPGLIVVGLALLAGLIPLLRLELARAEVASAIAMGAPRSALVAVRRAVALAPWSGLAWEQLATLAAAGGDRDAAEQAFRAGLARRPSSARLHYRHAAALARWGDREAAIAESARAVLLGPTHLQGYLQLAGLLQAAGRTTEAEEVYRRCDEVAQRPELTDAQPLAGYTIDIHHATALVQLGRLAGAAGRTAEACDALRRARPQLEAYRTDYDGARQLVRSLPPAEAEALLNARGLDAATRDQAAAYLREIEASLSELDCPTEDTP